MPLKIELGPAGELKIASKQECVNMLDNKFFNLLT